MNVERTMKVAQRPAAVDELIDRARTAMGEFKNRDQEQVDQAVRAVAWSVYKPEHARALAEMAVKDTGLGDVVSKVTKNTRKTFGTLRDLMRARTVGIIEENPSRGMVKYGKPVGVVGAVCPSTNPSATPVNKAMMALKGGNAVIIAPSPAGYRTTAAAVELMRTELAKSRPATRSRSGFVGARHQERHAGTRGEGGSRCRDRVAKQCSERHAVGNSGHRRRTRQCSGDCRFLRRTG